MNRQRTDHPACGRGAERLACWLRAFQVGTCCSPGPAAASGDLGGEIRCRRKINRVAGLFKLRSIPSFISPMAAYTVAKLPEGSDWLYQLKLDGSPYSVAVISHAPTQTCGKWGDLINGLLRTLRRRDCRSGEL
jgi:hypothetical protein